MKLFVWNDPVCMGYGGCCAYVIAADVDQARALAVKAPTAYFGLAPSRGDGAYFDCVRLKDADVARPPDRVLELPYAEIYAWQE
jgi:hypothetical protein